MVEGTYVSSFLPQAFEHVLCIKIWFLVRHGVYLFVELDHLRTEWNLFVTGTSIETWLQLGKLITIGQNNYVIIGWFHDTANCPWRGQCRLVFDWLFARSHSAIISMSPDTEHMRGPNELSNTRFFIEKPFLNRLPPSICERFSFQTNVSLDLHEGIFVVDVEIRRYFSLHPDIVRNCFQILRQYRDWFAVEIVIKYL